MVWWVVVTVVVVGVELGVLVWVGQARLPQVPVSPIGVPVYGAARSSAGYMFAWFYPGPRSIMRVVLGLGPDVCGADLTDDALTEQASRVDRMIREEVGASSGDSAARVWDVLLHAHAASSSSWTGRASELSIGVPIGVVLVGDRANTVIARQLRSTYAVIVPMETNKTFLFVRVLNALCVAAVTGAGVVGICMGIGIARRTIRRTQDRCAWCNYSLSGIAGDAVCPECGIQR